MGGWTWWDHEDRGFRQRMYRPFATTASVVETGAGRMLRLEVVDSFWVMRGDTVWLREHQQRAWPPLVTDHGRLMHLFLIRQLDQSAFAHLHPTTLDSVRFDAPLPGLPARRYRVFADLVHESGFAKTLVTSVELAPPMTERRPDASGDDGIYLGAAASADRATLPDGATVTWQRRNAPLVAGSPAALSFEVREPTGRLASLEPYLGMPGHAVVERDDGAVFIHLHPMSTVSMAAQETFSLRGQGDTAGGAIGSRIAMRDSAMAAHAVPGGRIAFPYAFPQPGRYRIWVQVKRRGQVETAAFDAKVGLSLAAEPAPTRRSSRAEGRRPRSRMMLRSLPLTPRGSAHVRQRHRAVPAVVTAAPRRRHPRRVQGAAAPEAFDLRRPAAAAAPSGGTSSPH